MKKVNKNLNGTIDYEDNYSLIVDTADKTWSNNNSPQ